MSDESNLLLHNITNQVRDLADRFDKRFDSMEAKFDKYVTESKFTVYKDSVEREQFAQNLEHKSLVLDVESLKSQRLPQWAITIFGAIITFGISVYIWVHPIQEQIPQQTTTSSQSTTITQRHS